MGVELGGWSFGAQFGDLNNDGTLDLYLTNGYVSLDRDRSYWYDFSKVAGGNSRDHRRREELAGDGRPQPVGLSAEAGLDQRRRGQIHGRGAGGRRDGHATTAARWRWRICGIAACWTWSWPIRTRTAAALQEHGRAGEQVDRVRVWKGTKSNRSAIGAQVTLFWNGQQQVQEVSGGSGFCAQNQRRLHFGLGKAPQIEKAVIRWPSGKSTDDRQAGHESKITR